ncbi:MAG: hypothetical protein JOZ41_21420 [Chloroflexi bacterium]|nr:hypothetical protein [Chloroflexota bacterium]
MSQSPSLYFDDGVRRRLALRFGAGIEITTRAELLAPAIGATAERLLDWCAAFAGMTALDPAASPGDSRARVQAFFALAAETPFDC